MSKKHPNSAWVFMYKPWYCFTHPWKFFRNVIYNIRDSYHRVVDGYCYIDWAEFGSYIPRLMSNMLRDLANNSSGYPGTPPFETYDKYSSWINKMADQLEFCGKVETDCDSMNVYYELYLKALENAAKRGRERLTEEEKKKYDNELTMYPMDDLTDEEKALKESFLCEQQRLFEKSKTLLAKTFKELSEHWDVLWD